MTKNKALEQLDKKYQVLEMEVGSDTRQLVSEIVELELEIERDCNQ